MEIEAKFAITDPEIYQRLQQLDQLADCTLSESQTKEVVDTYLDTQKRQILAAGYGCRRRELSTGMMMTLKSLGNANGAIHRRGEWEVALATDLPPLKWPDSPVRNRVRQIIGDEPLYPLFQLEQTRIVRQVSQGQHPVAELSLDNVHLKVGDNVQAYFELELELISPAREETLRTLVAHLQEDWHLQPEKRSKFERALAFVDAIIPHASADSPIV